MQKKKSHMM